MERTTGRGLYWGVQLESRDGKLVYGGLRGDRGGAGLVVGQEDIGVEIFGVHHGRGGMQATADRLCRTAEVPIARVGFFAANHPGHSDGVPAGRGSPKRQVPPGPI